MRIAAIALFSVVSAAAVADDDAVAGRCAEADLVRLAELALGFGPTTSYDEAQQIVWVDVTGCAHLHDATSDLEGERALAVRLGDRVRELGHACRVAIADGPRVSAAIARFYPVRGGGTRPIVVPPGRAREAIRVLPLDALPAAADTLRFLATVGMRTLGDVQKLPRASLGARLGAEVSSLMPFLDGDDRTPLRPYLPPETPEERAELEYGVAAHEALLFVAKMLCDRMGPRLLGRAMAAARLELVFKLDKALLPEGGDPQASCALALPAPLQRAGDLFAALRARIESLALPAPALAVTLRVPELARMDARARDLFIPEARADLALPRLAAELVAELGEERVGVLSLQDTWIPERRARLVPYGSRGSSDARARARDYLTGGTEPSRLVCCTNVRALPMPRVTGLTLVMRLEAIEWWKRGAVTARARDYGTGWAEGQGLAWIEIDRETGERTLRGWLD